MAFAKNGDHKIYFEESGKGVPIVLLEGLGYSTWMWNHQLSALSKELRCIIPDNRGVGRSTPLETPYTMRGFAEDVLSVLDSLDISCVYLLGVSMGGFIAQEVARMAPGKIEGLILVSTSCGGKKSLPMTKESYGEMVRTVDGESQRGRLERTMSIAFTKDFVNGRKQEFDKIIDSRIDWVQNGTQFMNQVLATTTFDSCSSNASFLKPTLIVAGTDDRVLPWTNSVLLYKSFQNSSLVLFKNQNHLLFIEEDSKFNKLVTSFISSVENRTFEQMVTEVI